MNSIEQFAKNINNELNTPFSINNARNIVNEVNRYFYTRGSVVCKTTALGEQMSYFSEFHKFWEEYHREILKIQIDIKKCEDVAEVLHSIYNNNPNLFADIWNTYGLDDNVVANVRFLTANQDFRGSRSFEVFSQRYKDDPSIFDIAHIEKNPEQFIKDIGITSLSQSDKRTDFAKNAARFVAEKGLSEPFQLLDYYNNDLLELRKNMIDYPNIGYGNKKTDMFLRDMVVLGIWKKTKNFDKIDVASDANTIKVALRSGIITTEIPLVSSFIDIFCYQYSYIDEMTAQAWRAVWQAWATRYPTETVSSPALLDYLIYNIIGRNYCKESLCLFKCEKYGHDFYWHSSRNRTCQICISNGERNSAQVVKKMLPCVNNEGKKVFLNMKDNFGFSMCPLVEVCKLNENSIILQPPKSISIKGQTGWTTAYTDSESGGGGLMA